MSRLSTTYPFYRQAGGLLICRHSREGGEKSILYFFISFQTVTLLTPSRLAASDRL
jgi:hypothetical protein